MPRDYSLQERAGNFENGGSVTTKEHERRETREGDTEWRWRAQNSKRKKGTASRRAFNAKAAVKPAVSTNVRNINLRELKPAYTS